MNRYERETLKVRILRLAELRSTGTPSALASRFETSERTIKRLVKELRDDGNDIIFCHLRRSYITRKIF
jgi:hypothetical protein